MDNDSGTKCNKFVDITLSSFLIPFFCGSRSSSDVDGSSLVNFLSDHIRRSNRIVIYQKIRWSTHPCRSQMARLVHRT